MLKPWKLTLSIVVGFSMLWMTCFPASAKSFPQAEAIGGPNFPNLESCTTCHLEENLRAGLTGTVVTVKDTTLYLVPFHEDYSLDSTVDSLEVSISPGMSFEIAQTYKLVDPGLKASIYGLLANTYGGKYLGVLLLSSSSGLYSVDYVKKNVRLSPVVTYIAGANDIYPNKVENILLALGQLSAYQDRHLGFQAGSYISILRSFGFYSYEAFQEYKVGALASGINAKAGGVCAAATGLASLAYLTKGAKIIDIVHHDAKHLYFQGPFSPQAAKVDSGISISPDGSFEELGFTLPKSGYFRVDIQLLPSGVVYKETDPKGLQGLSDAILILSISYSSKPLTEQTESIEKQVSSFQQYRESAHAKPLLTDNQVTQLSEQSSEVALANLQKMLQSQQ